MKIGLRAHDYGKLTVEELTSRISKDGFKAIQLALPKAIQGITSYLEVSDEQVLEIHKACEKAQLEVAVLGCYINPALIDDKARAEEVEKFLRALEMVKPLKAGCIGTETTHFNGTEEEREVAFNLLVDSVKQMVTKAESLGVDIGIEPVAYHTLNTPELTQRLLEEIPSKRLKIIFDPVNLLTVENIEKQDTLWERCFKCFGDKICAMHIKSIRLNANGQLEVPPLAEGVVNYEKIMAWLKINKPDIALLREEIKPEEAHLDKSFILQLINK
ncbi:AP endonuclease [Sporanaerobium hydrogeniformans]|uniref:AP endonuclease n=1 Tax=Sporanaerobium hydrogeniformans TaxID=3072179 RepID=A0AC61DCQ9_9FIRM|nr:sugar phosphate isomerase/epimerase family protein [Sporanaerobium hydrogeniformans]PHV70966.1 AP endonuclease [Sporanaerobium hydrogeniformans]